MSHAFTAKIISAIRKHPILYDTNHAEFIHRDLKADVYVQIAKDLDMDVEDLKKKWRSLRDCYMKCKKSMEGKLLAPYHERYKNWIWRKELRFLDNDFTEENDTVFGGEETEEQVAKDPVTEYEEEKKMSQELTVKIIDAMRQHPVLYDHDHDQFMNRDLKDKLMTQIAKDLNATVYEIKRKWRSLRDCYSKYKRALEGRLPSLYDEKYKNWIWRNELKFLDLKNDYSNTENDTLEDCNITEENDTLLCSGLETEDNKEPDNRSRTDETVIKYEFEPVNLEDEKESLKPIIKAVKKTLKRSKPTPASKPKRKRREERTDEIDLLFKSYSQLFRKFHPLRQSKLKLQIANLFAQEEQRAIDNKKKKKRITKRSQPSDDSDYEVYH